jgi:hypothetical protein
MAVLDNNSIVEAVENIVSKNKALDNAFFRKCENEPISKEKLKEFVINFYPITEAFALNSFCILQYYFRRNTQKKYNCG